MRRFTIALISITVIALSLTPLASAALPSINNPRIVPGKSIGGVALEMPWHLAKKAWGEGRGTCDQGFCTYARSNSAFGNANFHLSAHDPFSFVVDSISIAVGFDVDGDFKFDTKLAKFETKAGIHLGSKGGQIKRAYPHVEYFHGDADFYKLHGKGDRMTVFYVAPSSHRVTGISIFHSLCPCG